ncbi:YSIRK-type signal peptide-containing protein, partial [Streptococcus mitis]|uniref:Rib/alpha-like domain-containing protein n=1 Tax=Streptococcus mitis TaxID=28037 RepID=UPI0013601578|nr:YSIRK-type signal peptide-containing protein [Streptococcus mitis]
MDNEGNQIFYKGKHDREKQLRFSIRKVSFGAASVAIAAFMMFIGGGTVQADAIQSNDSSAASVSSNHQPKEYDKKTDNEDRVNTSNLKVSEATSENTGSKDVISSTESFNNESRQEEKQFIKADTSKLELAVARVQALLEKTEVNEKTEEVIKSANEELAKAQDLLSNDKVIQGDIDKELSSLNNIDFILKSIPKASIEKKLEKENKNQDPRNGKAIPGKGESGFRAEETRNVESKILENGNITASGTITTNDRMGNYSPTKFSYNVKLKDGSYHENDKISITFEELGSGSSLPETLSKDGKVFARRESIEELFTNEAAKGKKTSFWAQRDDSASLEEKEQAKLKNRGTKTRFTYKFTSAIESLKDVSFGGALNDYSLRYPEVSEDKLVTAKILVNNQTVVEKEYTVNKTNIKQEKPSEAPSTISSSGTLEFGQNGELINHSEQFNFSTNKYEYGVGTTFTIKLNDKSLNKFVKSGDFKKVRANLSNKSTTANTKINEEHVILKSPRTYAEFQVISLTDDELVVKIVGGKATSDTNYSFDWAAAGVSREPVSNTVNLYHSQTGKFGPVNETVKITKENSSDDLSGQYTTNMEISWDNPKKNSFDASGNWLKEYLELGNVAMRYINVANNNPILKATSIVKGGVAEVDKFATATPTKDFTEANVATEANNTTKKEETQNENVKTTTATAPYIIKGTDNKYYVFREYLKNSPYKRTSTSGTVYDAVSNIVAAYDEAKYGKVTVKYVKANDTATVLRENVLKDATAKLENIVGTNYSVTPEEEFSENGVVYKLVKTDLPNNSDGILSENPTEVVYKYVVKNQKANVVIKTTDGKHSTTVELTGEPGTALPNSEDITNKIKELKGKGYEVESDTYNVNGAHPDFDDQDDEEAGVSKPSQTFEITLKPRIIEVPSSTPHEKDSPVDPNGNNPELKWPKGLAESDLTKTAKRVISYVKKDSNTAAEEKALDDTVQTVSFTRKAKVNLVDKTVEYTDWESSNQTWEKVEVKTLAGYIADKKEIPAKEAVTPEKDTKVIPDETDKVTYTKIGSWTPINPTTGLEETPIPFPNDPTDPTKTGEITEIIPHKDGYTPKDGSGNSLTPIDPEHLDKGYHPPKITDPKANIKITYEKDDQKVKVKFVSVDPKTQQETELTDHALMLTGKTGETISERDVQTRIDVLKSMGYDIVDNPFDKNPVFDTLKDTTDKVSQEFIIKVQPRVSTAYPVYVVEGTKPSSEQLKDAVSTKGNDKTVDETKIPETTGKVGDDSLTVPITVTYGSGDKKREETVNVPVKVVKGYPQIVPVSEGNEQPSVKDSIDPDQYPEGSTFEYKEEVNTSEAGDKNVTVVVKDKAGNKLVEVPATVRVVESYPQYVPVNKEGISPKDSIDPSKFPEGTTFEYKEKPNTGSTGDKDVTVVAKLGTEIVAEIPAKIVVVDSKTQYVAENKENTQPDASKSVDEENYPEGSKFKFKEPVETSKAGDKETTVVVTDKDGNPLVEVPATVVVAKGYPQIVPVSEGNEQPSVKDSIDPDQYPEGSTFEYKEEVNTSEAGDKNVTVVVKDKAGNKLVEVPATVRVVESYPQYVPVNKEGISPKDSIDPSKFPEGTTFEYKEKPNTGSTGDKDVTVVAKLGTEIVAEIPAKIVVVDSKTQYVPVDKSNKQPDVSKSIDPEQYPDGVTFKYKTPVDTTTPGEKDVIVEAKDEEDKLVEVPAKVKVVEGKEQLIPVNPTEKPQARDSITPSDYPEGSTFEYKVPDGQTEPFDATTVGDKLVTVVVKDKNGNVLVEVPATIKVVEAKPKPIETPVTNTPLTKDDIAKYVKDPEGGKVTNVENVPDLTTPGKKNPVKVTVTLPNGKTITVDVPVNVTPVKGIETPVTNTPLTPEDYTKGIKVPEGSKVTNVENIPDLTTPGKKAPVKVTVELPNGKTITVDVPVNVTPVKGIETPVTNTPL